MTMAIVFLGFCILAAAALRAAVDWQRDSRVIETWDDRDEAGMNRGIQRDIAVIDYRLASERRERERDRRESEARFEERYGGKTAAVVSTVVDKLTTE